MIVNGSLLPWPPNKTHNRKALVRIAVKEILLIPVGVSCGISVWQPFVVAYQLLHQRPSTGQQVCLDRPALNELGNFADEIPK
jgi:hypothetical protein